MIKQRHLQLKVIGGLLFVALILLRSLTWANLDQVWVFGRELHWGCWFKEHFGIPCPTCGMTRSVILTLHGNFSDAVLMNPAGPFLVAGVAIVGILLMRPRVFGLNQLKPRHLALGLSIYGWIFISVIFGQWTLQLP